jgi:prepilin signal peptidase PulO-like enzyme (type II secretory pathway)
MIQLSGALFLAAAAFVGIACAAFYAPSRGAAGDHGPPPSKPHPVLLLAACAVLGALLLPHAAPLRLVSIALCAVSLSAIWCIDVRFGIIPDGLSLGTLAALLVIAAVARDAAPLISAVVVAIPFAALAAATRGAGLGWGDVKLAAIGGALLGAPAALFAFAVGSLAAGIFAFLRGRRATPVAFAPYMIAAIALFLPLTAGV